MNRRDFLTYSPVLAASAALPFPAQAEAEDPIMPLYRQWIDARAEWKRLSYLPGAEDFDTPEMKAAEAREDAAFWEMIELTPVSQAGIAAFASLIWSLSGPAFPEGHPVHDEECSYPKNRIIVAIWRAASGKEGLPVVSSIF